MHNVSRDSDYYYTGISNVHMLVPANDRDTNIEMAGIGITVYLWLFPKLKKCGHFKIVGLWMNGSATLLQWFLVIRDKKRAPLS